MKTISNRILPLYHVKFPLEHFSSLSNQKGFLQGNSGTET